MGSFLKWFMGTHPIVAFPLAMVSVAGILLAILSDNSGNVEFGKSVFLVVAIGLSWTIAWFYYTAPKK